MTTTAEERVGAIAREMMKTGALVPSHAIAWILELESAFHAHAAQVRREERERAAGIADEMATAAERVLRERHDKDAAVQFDTANEIAAAIREAP